MSKVSLGNDLCAAIAQSGERQTEDLEVPGSIPGLGKKLIFVEWSKSRSGRPDGIRQKSKHLRSGPSRPDAYA